MEKINNPRAYDPYAPILSSLHATPLGHMLDWRRRRDLPTANVGLAWPYKDLYYPIYPSPDVAELIANKFRQISGSRKATRTNIKPIISLIGFDNLKDMAQLPRDFPVAKPENLYNREIIDIFTEYHLILRDICSLPQFYTTDKGFANRENELYFNAIQPIRQRLIHKNLYHAPHHEKELALVTGARNVMVFRYMNNLKVNNVQLNDQMWEGFYSQMDKHEKTFSVSKFYNNDSYYCAILDVDIHVFEDEMISVNGFVDEFGEDMNMRSLMRIVYRSIRMIYDCMAEKDYGAIAIRAINLNEYLISLVNFLINFANYYNSDPDQQIRMKTFDRPIPLRCFVSFKKYAPVTHIMNNHILSELVNRADINIDNEHRGVLRNHLWKGTVEMKSLAGQPFRYLAAPQLWNYGYLMLMDIPRIMPDGSLVDKTIKSHPYSELTTCRYSIAYYVNSSRIYGLSSFVSYKFQKTWNYDQIGFMFTFNEKYM